MRSNLLCLAVWEKRKCRVPSSLDWPGLFCSSWFGLVSSYTVLVGPWYNDVFLRSFSGTSGCDASLVEVEGESFHERPMPVTLENGNGVRGVLSDVTECSGSDWTLPAEMVLLLRSWAHFCRRISFSCSNSAIRWLVGPKTKYQLGFWILIVDISFVPWLTLDHA